MKLNAEQQTHVNNLFAAYTGEAQPVDISKDGYLVLNRDIDVYGETDILALTDREEGFYG